MTVLIFGEGWRLIGARTAFDAVRAFTNVFQDLTNTMRYSTLVWRFEENGKSWLRKRFRRSSGV